MKLGGLKRHYRWFITLLLSLAGYLVPSFERKRARKREMNIPSDQDSSYAGTAQYSATDATGGEIPVVENQAPTDYQYLCLSERQLRIIHLMMSVLKLHTILKTCTLLQKRTHLYTHSDEIDMDVEGSAAPRRLSHPEMLESRQEATLAKDKHSLASQKMLGRVLPQRWK